MATVRGPYYIKESPKGEWWVCGYNGKIVRRYAAHQEAMADADAAAMHKKWAATA